MQDTHNPNQTSPVAPAISLVGKIRANPVVSCRPEGDDGALLFNPDTDSTLLINPTGILVWTYLSEARTIAEVATYLASMFSNCPDAAALQKDAETFVSALAPDFIVEV